MENPNVDANWHYYAIANGGKATISGLTVGSTLWVRLRSCGLKGVMGE